MESRQIYEDSYNYINKLAATNTGDIVTIDYKRLDEKTRGELREAITKVCTTRKREIYNNILSGVHNC